MSHGFALQRREERTGGGHSRREGGRSRSRRAGSWSRQAFPGRRVQEDEGCKARANRKIEVIPEGPFKNSWLGKTIRKIAKGNWKGGLCSSSFKAGV